MALLQHVGVPKVFGTFNNGYVYEYIEGEPLTSARMRDDTHLLELAADALVQWHQSALFGDLHEIDRSDARDCIFRRIDDWHALSCQLLGIDDGSSPSRGASPEPIDVTSTKSHRFRRSVQRNKERLQLSRSPPSDVRHPDGGGVLARSPPSDARAAHAHQQHADALARSPDSARSHDDAGGADLLAPGSPDVAFDFDGFVKRLRRYVARTKEQIAQSVLAARARHAAATQLALAAAVCHNDANPGNAILSADRITWVDVECECASHLHARVAVTGCAHRRRRSFMSRCRPGQLSVRASRSVCALCVCVSLPPLTRRCVRACVRVRALRFTAELRRALSDTKAETAVCRNVSVARACRCVVTRARRQIFARARCAHETNKRSARCA
jgi:hypothetical protein